MCLKMYKRQWGKSLKLKKKLSVEIPSQPFCCWIGLPALLVLQWFNIYCLSCDTKKIRGLVNMRKLCRRYLTWIQTDGVKPVQVPMWTNHFWASEILHGRGKFNQKLAFGVDSNAAQLSPYFWQHFFYEKPLLIGSQWMQRIPIPIQVRERGHKTF